MQLSITSPTSKVFEGEISKLVVPTLAGEIAILPEHTPLTSVVVPGIAKITPVKKEDADKQGDFLFQDDTIVISVSKGLLMVDGNGIKIVTSSVVTNPSESEEMMLKMQEDLSKEIEHLKAKGAIDDLEKALISYDKIAADIKLFKMKGMLKD